MFFDSHVHKKGIETGGFLIGLEGKPVFDDVMNNNDILDFKDENYLTFYYVEKSNILNEIRHKYLKFHPQREKYSPQEVISTINNNAPKAVIIDTLNEPYWIPYDYWSVARKFPQIKFIFAHSGGYLVNDFIKICHIQKNVWLDFSLTHTYIGQYGKGLPYVTEAIEYSLKSAFKNRVLLGSDYPFFSQEDVLNFYQKLNAVDLLNNNFQELKEKIQ